MGLTNVTADYALREDGNIRVKNEGETITGRSSLEGVAIIVNPSVGKLKVSFLYPLFFGDYLILKIDRNGYQTALIGGPEPNFLWIFSREPTISSVTENEYIQFAKTIGYDTNRLLAY
jgi:apolipoprotein D and lipocalin family protein